MLKFLRALINYFMIILIMDFPFSTTGKVMFFCPEVSLVKQQYEKMETLFEGQGYNIDYLIGSEVQDKPSIAEMIRTEQVYFRQWGGGVWG